MTIGNRIKSDHAPIEMTIQWKGRAIGQERNRKERGKRSIIRWEEGGVEEFRERLRLYGGTNSWERLKDKVAKAIPRVEVRGRRQIYYEEKWWDEECHRKKEKLKEALGKLRRGNKRWGMEENKERVQKLFGK